MKAKLADLFDYFRTAFHYVLIVIVFFVVTALVGAALTSIVRLQDSPSVHAPGYQTGDCLVDKPIKYTERWEKPSNIVYKITEVGNLRYHLVFGRYWGLDSAAPLTEFKFVDENYDKISCEANK